MTEPFHDPSSFLSSVPQPGGQTANVRTYRKDQGEVGGGCRALVECLILSTIVSNKLNLPCTHSAWLNVTKDAAVEE